MIKKLLITAVLLGAAVTASAQATVWVDDFNDEDISDWTFIDADGDGNLWDVYAITDIEGNPITPVSLISRSWDNDALTPDNWAISPLIDLSNASGQISLSWTVQAAEEPYNEENYTVYVATTATQSAFLASPVQFNGLPGVTGAPAMHSLDLSSFAGQTVYVAFRHFDSVDMDFLSIDDVTITAQTLGINNSYAAAFNVYPNPANGIVNIEGPGRETIEGITLTDANGRIVRDIAAGTGNAAQVDISDLSSGIYFLNITGESGKAVKKIVKQ